ncbi:MAG: putative dehydrogenase [Frankiales bacterium]|nr:putative dehydrogenase [Frankiales bacterium]
MTTVGVTVGVTGAARGIGAAIARSLRSAGYDVLLGDLDASVVELAEELGGTGGLLDVTDTQSFERWLALVPKVDVLVNNAGIMWVGAADEEPEGVAEKQMAVNFHGAVRGTLLAARQGARTIVTVASVASYVSPAGEASYAATKHALLGWMKAARQELSGVQLCLVLPTVVDTELAVGTASGGVPRLTPEQVADAVVKVIVKPRFETFVPARVSVLVRVLALLPQRGKDAMYGRLVPNQTKADLAVRQDYESRRLS